MTLFHLVRHGETDWNRARRIQGRTDIPLNDLGRSQAESAGRYLRGVPVDRVVASSLSRAGETGAIIAEALGLPAPELRDDLVEREYGEAEGLTIEQVEARYPDGQDVPGRELPERVVERVAAALAELAVAHPDESIVVATHGAVIRSMITAVSPEDAPERGVPIRNGSVHGFRLVDGVLGLTGIDVDLDGGHDADGGADERELRQDVATGA